VARRSGAEDGLQRRAPRGVDAQRRDREGVAAATAVDHRDAVADAQDVQVAEDGRAGRGVQVAVDGGITDGAGARAGGVPGHVLRACGGRHGDPVPAHRLDRRVQV